MNQIEGPNLLEYAEDAAKMDIEPMVVDQKEINMATHYLGKLLGELLTGPQVKSGSVIPSHCGGHASPGKLENPIPVIKSYCSG